MRMEKMMFPEKKGKEDFRKDLGGKKKKLKKKLNKLNKLNKMLKNKRS